MLCQFVACAALVHKDHEGSGRIRKGRRHPHDDATPTTDHANVMVTPGSEIACVIYLFIVLYYFYDYLNISFTCWNVIMYLFKPKLY